MKPETTNVILMIVITAIIMFAVRFAPFALFGGRRTVPKTVSYLGEVLPPAVMAILIVYCLKTISFTSTANYLPQLISVAVVVLLHVWKRNNLLSIGVGTVCYMLLIHYVFV